MAKKNVAASRGCLRKFIFSFYLVKTIIVFCTFYLSVLKGEAGNPSLLYKFGFTGLSAHAYLT